jgi:putative transposase
MSEGAAHHRRSMRLAGYDYAQPGAYFVTMVTHRRLELFGRMVDREMQVFRAGQFAEACWRQIPDHFGHVELGAFVVMPNHVHGILVLKGDMIPQRRGTIYRAPTPAFGRPTPGSIPTIVASYKAAVTRQIHRRPRDSGRIWQRNYYEHVIRNEADWRRLQLYIEANPQLWPDDAENPGDLRLIPASAALAGE